jgi:hypothetical protein
MMVCKGASIWLQVPVLAWSIGMVIIFAATDFLAVMLSLALAIGLVIAALLLTGGIVGTIHGSILVWLLRKSDV